MTDENKDLDDMTDEEVIAAYAKHAAEAPMTTGQKIQAHVAMAIATKSKVIQDACHLAMLHGDRGVMVTAVFEEDDITIQAEPHEKVPFGLVYSMDYSGWFEFAEEGGR